MRSAFSFHLWEYKKCNVNVIYIMNRLIIVKILKSENQKKHLII